MSDLAVRDDLMRQFDAGLAKVKYELQKNLNEMDPLDRERLEQMLSTFTQRLVVFQHEFLEYLARAQGGAKSEVEEFTVNIPPTDKIPELASVILAGGAGALLVALIPVGTSGVLFWTTTVTVAAFIGTVIGVPAAAVTGAAGVVIGVVVGVCVAISMKRKRRSLIRKAILKRFDGEIAPRLREWATGRLNG